MLNKIIRGSCLSALLWGASLATAAAAADDARSMEELRDTVINLLDALVQKGVLTKEQAQAMVADAQAKAAASAAANAKTRAAQEEEEKNAVRVPYVPQIVKDEISKQVAEEVKPQVVESVMDQAREQRWGVPGALPDWLTRIRLIGDVRVRYQNDRYPNGNVAGYYLDFNSINSAGGIAAAGLNEFYNTTDNQNRMRVRARLGAEAAFGDDFTAAVRLATGNIQDPSSESQTLGNYGGHYNVGFDEFFIRWAKKTDDGLPWVTQYGGRFANPYFAPTELVFARDFTFEGLATQLRWGFGDDGGPDQSQLFVNFGAYPLEVVPLATQDNKYLVGGQLGTVLRFGDSDQALRIAAAYYDFLHVEGIPNPQDVTFYNFTAPAFIRFGNTVFDISNSSNPASTTNLFALASRFRLADIALRYDLPISERYTFGVSAEAVRNVGFNENEILARTGSMIPKYINGNVEELSFGDPTVTLPWHWRAAVGYRYVQSDAVIDAFTDADFHGGGTNARGPYLSGSLGVAPGVWFQLRYFSADVVDGPQFSLDTLQLDLNAQF
jgi:polyhydroxyalkanoate synthesis regulator phasin